MIANPYLMHDNLQLDKGVEKGGSYDKTRSACNSKKCPNRHWAFITSYCLHNVGVEQEVF